MALPDAALTRSFGAVPAIGCQRSSPNPGIQRTLWNPLPCQVTDPRRESRTSRCNSHDPIMTRSRPLLLHYTTTAELRDSLPVVVSGSLV